MGVKEIAGIVPGLIALPETYIDTYRIVYLMTPILNKAIKALDEKQHLILIGILLMYFCMIGTFLNWQTWHYLGWALTLYIIAAYIRLYPHRLFERKKLHAGITILSILLMWLSELVFDYLESDSYYYLISNANKITVFACALGMFLWFKNLHIGKSEWINRIAASTFGVFVIHANSDTMRQFLWKDFLHNTAFYHSQWLFLHAILSIIGIYVVCTLIDMLRIRFIEKPFFRMMDTPFDRLEQWFCTIGNKIYKMITS